MTKSVGRGTWALSLLTVGAALAVACGNLKQQDPFADKGEDVKENIGFVRKMTPTPTPYDFQMQIDSKDFLVFTEGVEGKEYITGRVLTWIDGEEPELNKNFKVQIDNPEDFPEHRYDKATGLFTWMPARGSATTNDAVTVQTLNVSLVATSKGGRVLGHPRQIPVHVRRLDGEPKIIMADNLTQTPVTEGQSRSFKVLVKDPNGGTGGIVKPKLLILPANSSRMNLASYVTVESGPDRDVNDPTLWKFGLRIDTSGAEVTRWDTTGSFLLIAMAKFGRQSPPLSVDVRLNTSVERPLTSWLEGSRGSVAFAAGQQLNFSFSVFDPKTEGRIIVTFTMCPQDATCGCDAPPAFSGPATCQVRWEASATAKLPPKDYRIDFTAENNVNGRKQAEQYSRTIRLLPAPVSTPTPTATATATPTPAPSPSATP